MTGGPAAGPSPEQAVELIRRTLIDAELQFEEPSPGTFVANLPGQKRLKTSCWLTVGAQGLAVEAFVMRRPDENADAVHRWLLAHNARMFAVGWAIDDAGDVYLTGRLPHAAVSPDEIDRLLGAVLSYADDSFNTMLEIGFGSSIRREWEWRVKRGEPLDNLRAFEAFVKRDA